MIAATLWIEITIAGSIYIAALFFLALLCLNVDSLSFLLTWKDASPYIIAAGVAASYIIGIVAHRMLQLYGPSVARFLGIRLVRYPTSALEEPEHAAQMTESGSIVRSEFTGSSISSSLWLHCWPRCWPRCHCSG